MKLRKALGESTVGVEGFRLCPTESARILHPLVCKSLVNAEAPLQWKGAQLAALYKGKGSRMEESSYRDVALQDPDAKVYGKILRRFLLDAVRRMGLGLQFGSGCCGGGCDLPHLAAQSALLLGEAHNCCSALLFLDVRVAFAAMVREVILPLQAGKESWLRLLVQSGYPVDFANEVMDMVCAACNWQEYGMTSHALAVLADFHTDTWFSQDLLADVVASTRGCSAGNPIADLIYIAADAILEKRLRIELEAAGLTCALADNGALAFFGLSSPPYSHSLGRIAYVDDGVIPLLAPACSIAARVKETAEIVNKVYAFHGLSLNFAPGKSEAMISFHGPGAQAARTDILLDRGAELACSGVGGQVFRLRVVPRYKHLGGVISANGDLLADIGPKMAIVRQTARQLRKVFLRDPAIPLKQKGLVLQALVLSKGLHLGGCWPQLLPREARVVKRALVDLLRPLLGSRPVDARLADDEVVCTLGVLHPARLLTLLRAQVAVRVATRAPWPVLLLLFAVRDASRSWLRVLADDLAHLAKAPCLAEMADAPLSRWFQFFRSFPVQAKQALVKAAGSTNWLSTQEIDREIVFTTYCFECGAAAQDRQALSIHLFRSHGVRRWIRAYVEGTTCLICGLMFASRQRLIDHLAEKGQICLHNYVLRYSPLSPDRVQQLDADGRSEFSRRRRLEGAHGVRHHGPFLQNFTIAGEPITTRHPLGPNRRWSG